MSVVVKDWMLCLFLNKFQLVKQNIWAPVGSKGRKQLFKALSGQESPPEVPTVPSVLATFASKPLMMNGDSGGSCDFYVVNDCVTN